MGIEISDCTKFLKLIQLVADCPDEGDGVFSVMVNLDDWIPNVGEEVEISSPSQTMKGTVISANRIYRVESESESDSILFEESDMIPTGTFSILLQGINRDLVNPGDIFSKSGFCDKLYEHLE